MLRRDCVGSLLIMRIVRGQNGDLGISHAWRCSDMGVLGCCCLVPTNIFSEAEEGGASHVSHTRQTQREERIRFRVTTTNFIARIFGYATEQPNAFTVPCSTRLK